MAVEYQEPRSPNGQFQVDNEATRIGGQEQQTDRIIKLPNTKEIPKESLELEKYIGQRTTIAAYEEREGKYGMYVRLLSDTLDHLNDGRELRASRIFSLQRHSQSGEIGWTNDSPLALFMRKHGVAHYRDLIGKAVTIITRARKRDGKEFLTF